MKLLVVILLLSASALGQEGIPGNIGTEKFPPILVGGTELDATQRCASLRCKMLWKC